MAESYNEAELREARDILIRAEEIKKNLDMMKQLKPYLEETEENLDTIRDLDDLRKKAREVSARKDDDKEEENQEKKLGEKEEESEDS